MRDHGRRYQAVLVELEGVLAATAPLRRQALQRAFRDEGAAVAEGDLPREAALLPPTAATALVARAIGLALDDTALELVALRARRHFGESIGRGLTLTPGARDFVQALHGRHRLAIVTRATRREASLILELAELDGAFEVVVAAEDAEAKPSPAPYLAALDRLGRGAPLDARAAIALEDGAPGLRAACDAGIASIAVGEVPAHEALHGHGILRSLEGVGSDELVRAVSTPTAVRP